MAAPVKPLKWIGASLESVRAFEEDARQRTGYQLYRVQSGLEPSDWKSLNTIGSGVREIRIHTKNEFRVIYVATFEEAVYVLHAFSKKTRKTPKHDLELATSRFKELVKKRKHYEGSHFEKCFSRIGFRSRRSREPSHPIRFDDRAHRTPKTRKHDAEGSGGEPRRNSTPRQRFNAGQDRCLQHRHANRDAISHRDQDFDTCWEKKGCIAPPRPQSFTLRHRLEHAEPSEALKRGHRQQNKELRSIGVSL
jgi:phage-related protein